MNLHQLYRHFDKSGALLYVGRSIAAVCRLVSHGRSEWAHLIAFVEIEAFSSADALAYAEARAIRNESPIYNKVQPILKSGGGVESRNADGRTAKAAPLGTAVKSHPDLSGNITCQISQAGPAENRDAVGVAPDPPDTFLQPRKRGKPRIGETRDKPWENLGMSKRTWQRRRAEARKKGND